MASPGPLVAVGAGTGHGEASSGKPRLLTVRGAMRAEGEGGVDRAVCAAGSGCRVDVLPSPGAARTAALDQVLVELVGRLIAENPDYGLRRPTVLVRRELRAAVNRGFIGFSGEGLAAPGAAAGGAGCSGVLGRLG